MYLLCYSVMFCRSGNDVHLSKLLGSSSTLHENALLVSRNVIIGELAIGHLWQLDASFIFFLCL